MARDLCAPVSTTFTPPTKTVRTSRRPANKDIFVEPEVAAAPARSGCSASSTTMSARCPASIAPIARAERLRAAGQRIRIERAAGGFAFAQGHHVARAMLQALRIFELAQFCRRHRSGCWNRCRCRSGRRLSRNDLAVEDAVAEAAFGERAQARDRAGIARARSVSSSVMCVAWIRHQRASIAALSSSHCTGRAPSAAMQSSTSLVCSAAWICTGTLRRSRRHRAQLLGRHRAQRMRRDAEHARPARSPRSRGSAPSGVRNRSVGLRKRTCPGLGAASPKPP